MLWNSGNCLDKVLALWLYLAIEADSEYLVNC